MLNSLNKRVQEVGKGLTVPAKGNVVDLSLQQIAQEFEKTIKAEYANNLALKRGPAPVANPSCTYRRSCP